MYKLDKIIISTLCGQIAEQRDGEIFLLWDNFLSKIKHNWFIEIGVKFGGTSKLWEICGFKNGIGVDIDISNFRAKLGNNYNLIEGNSRDVSTISRVKDILCDEKVDFLFIDGAHDYDSCLMDFYNYKEFVREGGVIAFHDIVPENMGVKDVFREVKDNYTGSKEFVIANGIGAFFK